MADKIPASRREALAKSGYSLSPDRFDDFEAEVVNQEQVNQDADARQEEAVAALPENQGAKSSSGPAQNKSAAPKSDKK